MNKRPGYIAIPKTKVPEDIRKLDTLKGGQHLVMNYGQKPNITKAKKYLNWEPSVPLSEGLKKTIEYFLC